VDVIVVGAGPSGLSCAYKLAEHGLEVLVLERGDYPGAKNMFGGIFFSPVMEKLFGDFYEKAPWERFISQRRFSILSGVNDISLHLKPQAFNEPPYNHSFIAKRGNMDKWFSQRVEEKGASIICNYNVEDFLFENGKVVGITSGGDDDSLLADVIVCAEGANSILSEKAGLRGKIQPNRRSIAIKENIKLSEDIIRNRFGLSDCEGAAFEYFGSSVEGLLGNGFIYTNKDSLSVGVGFSIQDFMDKGDSRSSYDVLEDFKNHPAIKPLIAGGTTGEYMAHMIPCDNFNNLPQLYRDGLLLIGDAAGLLNTSFFHEGVNLAMGSGLLAAETIIELHGKKDFSAQNLALYKEKLENSFIFKDLKNCKNFISFLHSHKNIISDYPALANEILVDYFSVSEKPKNRIKKDIFHKVRKNVNIPRAVGDMWGAFRNLV